MITNKKQNMKKIFLGLIVTGSVFAATAQTTDKRFYIGVNGRAGKISHKEVMRSPGRVYTNAITQPYNRSLPEIELNNAFGFDGQIGYFFSPDAKWGIGTGAIVMQYDGTITADNMLVEYQSWDFNGDTYRQVVSNSKPIVEEFTMRSISIPLVMKYRTSLSKKLGVVFDAGILYNVSAKSEYTGNTAFNYEAIYQFNITSDGKVSTVYDAGAQPDENDWMITRAQYQKDKGDGREAEYFEGLKKQGYNVGLDVAATGSGTKEYKTGTIGGILQGAFTLQLTDAMQANLGFYYMHQNFRNDRATTNKRITDKPGEYNTIQNNIVRFRNSNYGISLGLSMFLF
jgi:hypothetical protein